MRLEVIKVDRPLKEVKGAHEVTRMEGNTEYANANLENVSP